MDWDSIKLFLALHRNGSARAVATEQNTSASTITRKITRLEEALNVKLFSRDKKGFELTEHGKELLQVALRMESDAYEIERKLQAKNAVMKGLIRVTIPNHFTCSPLINYLKSFADTHPGVELEVIPSWSRFDLNRGEADLALRILYKDSKPPEELVGLKLVDIYSANYASKHYLATHDLENPEDASWVGWDDQSRYPDWVLSSAFPHLPIKHLLADPFAQLGAAKAHMGMVMMPCFLCDPEDELERIPPDLRWHRFDLWMLSHPDLRDTARFRELRQHLRLCFQADRSFWAGDI